MDFKNLILKLDQLELWKVTFYEKWHLKVTLVYKVALEIKERLGIL